MLQVFDYCLPSCGVQFHTLAIAKSAQTSPVEFSSAHVLEPADHSRAHADNVRRWPAMSTI